MTIHHRARGVAVRYGRAGVVSAFGLVGLCAPSTARDLNGAWVTSLDMCTKGIVRTGNKVEFARDSDFYGSGFVVDGNALRGKMARCKIMSRKESGATIHIQATCSTDILASTNSFDLRMVSDNELVRTFPGISEMDTSYYRCP